jgi:hypothetical protein
MKRFLLVGTLALTPFGCQLPPERTTALPPPLPEKVSSLPYAELLTRARAQAMLANEAFYKDSWGDLEDAAKGLEQTARYLPKADDVPAKHKDTLPVTSADLSKEAGKLREAAVAKDVKKSTASLQKIQLMVREMRLAP